MKEQLELLRSYRELPSDKKLYFASDFHLGIPNEEKSREREQRIIKWLEHISKDASAIFLVGDIFDFWFEYKNTVPKGYIRFLGKLAELRDQGIAIEMFTGNHDLWMADYFPSQLDINIHRNPVCVEVNNKRLYVGHGDGLGPGDTAFKIIKKIFTNPICKWLFQWIHPNIGVSLANHWSRKSRLANGIQDDEFKGENERLWKYCQVIEEHSHYDYYIFGHRHLQLELPVSDNSTYYNLGEWVNQSTYLEFDGNKAQLKTFNA